MCSHNLIFRYYTESLIGFYIGTEKLKSFNLSYELRPYLAWKCKLSELIMEDKCVNVTVDGKRVFGQVLGILPSESRRSVPAYRDYVIDHKPRGIFYIETNLHSPHAKPYPFTTRYLDEQIHSPFKLEREALKKYKYKKFMPQVGLEVKKVLFISTKDPVNQPGDL